MKSIFSSLFLLFTLVALNLGFAQDYVVTTSGDTIKGDVRPVTTGYDLKVVVRGENKSKTTVPILKTKSYTFRGNTYKPVRTAKGYTYMKIIKDGYLSIYGYQMENQTAFDGLYLQKIDGSSLDVPNLSFKKLVTNFIEDCPSVAEKVSSGEYNRSDLEKIVDDYNACIDTRSADVIVTKKDVVNQKGIQHWKTLQKRIDAAESFDGKADAIDMIEEIDRKVVRGESVPKFMVDGIRNILRNTPFEQELNAALAASGL